MILVTGATGNVGGAVANELASRRIRFRTLVRDAASAATLTPYGCEVVVGDLSLPGTFDGALDGVDRAFLVMPPFAGQHQTEVNFADAARRNGVRHVVKQSMLGADADSPCRLMASHGRSERYLTESGLPATFLRANAFMENTLAFAPGVATRRVILSSIPEAPVSHVGLEDVARVAVDALTGQGHEGRTYELTGPEALSFVDIAAQLADATGQPVNHVTISDDDARRYMEMAGVNPWWAAGLTELFDIQRSGEAAGVTRDVAEVTGRPPMSYRNWAVLRASLFSAAAAPAAR